MEGRGAGRHRHAQRSVQRVQLGEGGVRHLGLRHILAGNGRLVICLLGSALWRRKLRGGRRGSAHCVWRCTVRRAGCEGPDLRSARPLLRREKRAKSICMAWIPKRSWGLGNVGGRCAATSTHSERRGGSLVAWWVLCVLSAARMNSEGKKLESRSSLMSGCLMTPNGVVEGRNGWKAHK